MNKVWTNMSKFRSCLNIWVVSISFCVVSLIFCIVCRDLEEKNYSYGRKQPASIMRPTFLESYPAAVAASQCFGHSPLVLMQWMQCKKPQLSAKYGFWKKLLKKSSFGNFSWFFQKLYWTKHWGFYALNSEHRIIFFSPKGGTLMVKGG